MSALPAYDVAHFRARVLQDALNEATAQEWHRRTRAFRGAAPTRGDDTRRTVGLPSLATADLATAGRRCREIATACEHRAHLAAVADVDPEVWAALGWALAGWVDSAFADSCVAWAEALVEGQLVTARERALEDASDALRHALAAGDRKAIAEAALEVDRLDHARPWDAELWTESVAAMLRRHRRVIAAVDTLLADHQEAA